MFVGIATAVIAVVALLLFRSRRPSTDTGGGGASAAGPWTRSEVISAAGILLGTVVGLVGYVFPAGNDSPPVTRATNPVALAALIRQGPFSKEVPAPLTVVGLQSADIGDPETSARVDAIELVIPVAGSLQTYAHMEIYETTDQARRRAASRVDRLRDLYGPNVQGDGASYCALVEPDGWECGGSKGLVYAETSLSPGSNANRPLATGLTAAMLAYADEKARVAAD